MTTVVSLERPQLSVRGRIDDAVARARQLGRTTLLSHVEQLPFAPDPVAFLAASSAALGSGTLWEQPAMRPRVRRRRVGLRDPCHRTRPIRPGLGGDAGPAVGARS